MLASLTLTHDKIAILQNPSYVPSCNINPVLACGSVMMTPQSSTLGLPNPILGIAGFTVVVVAGVLSVAKVQLPRWFWAGLLAGILVGAVFVHWLIFVSLYRVGALCPYCMVVWVVTISLLVVMASIVLRPVLESRNSGVAHLVYRWRWSIAVLWFTGVAVLIALRFRDYWATLL